MRNHLWGGLKARLIFGYFLIAVVSLSACFFGLSRFMKLEARLSQVNEELLPLYKEVSHLDNAFFILEGDLDRSIVDEVFRPRDTLFQGWDNRIQNLNQFSSGFFSAEIAKLQKENEEIRSVAKAMFADWQNRDAYLQNLSEKRANFRSELRGLLRNVDRDIRSASLAVEDEVKHSGLIAGGILAFSAVIVLLLALWINGTLAPLSKLTESVKRISQSGLNEDAIRELATVQASRDEVGVFAAEFQRMASSLLDQHRELRRQREALEEAHGEMARRNQELRLAQDKIAHQEKLSLVGKLAAQMAHEVRNPLNAVGLHLDILERELELRGVGEHAQLLKPLQHELDRLISVTDGYLEMARAPRIKEEALNLNEVVEEVGKIYEPLFREHGISFSVDRGLIPCASGDRGRITQVLGNLIKNAAEAFHGTDRKLRFIRVSTAHNRATDRLMLSVMDNGGGIAKDASDGVFTPFFTTKAQGTGLGLAHSKQVIEEHGGEITFESQAGQGTKFTIQLPVLESTQGGSA